MGKVYLVGAGPGAPDLLTLRAAEILERAELVFHDALVHPQTLALAARARKILVGKRSGRHSTAQSFINKRLVDAARKHGVVVRLKGGDPMLFGRAQEEIDALREVLAFAFEASLMTGQAQQTAITRKLAAWAAILAVPTAIAGIYGMNFEHMPELKWRFGYFLVIAVIAAICSSLYWRFHRNGWL